MVMRGYAVDLDELAWVARASLGEEAAFVAIYQRYEQRVYAYIYAHIKGNRDDAADLTQETFLKAYQGLLRLGSGQMLNLSAWLYRIASNTCIDVIRRRRLISWLPWEHSSGGGAVEPISDHPSGDPEGSCIQRETRAEVCGILRRMNTRNCQALWLKEYQGMSCDEIAVVMGVSCSAVKSILFRAREEFRKLYSAESSGQKAIRCAVVAVGPSVKVGNDHLPNRVYN